MLVVTSWVQEVLRMKTTNLCTLSEHIIFYYTLYKDSPLESTDVVWRHVSFVQMTCIFVSYTRRHENVLFYFLLHNTYVFASGCSLLTGPD